MNVTYFFRAIIFVLVFILCAPVYSQRTITVTGEGKAKTKPDYAIVSFALASQDESVQGVYAKGSEYEKKLRASMAVEGAVNELVKQRTYILKPQYDQSNTEQGPPKLIGYTHFGIYEVKVTPLYNIPKIMDAAAKIGAGNIMLESFHSSQIEEVNDRALKNAIADARGKAVKIAQEIGVSVGDILSFSQTGASMSPEINRDEGKNPGDKMSTNEVKVSSSVSVTFSIK